MAYFINRSQLHLVVTEMKRLLFFINFSTKPLRRQALDTPFVVVGHILFLFLYYIVVVVDDDDDGDDDGCNDSVYCFTRSQFVARESLKP